MTHQWQSIDRGYGRQFSHEVMVAQDEDCDADPQFYQQCEDGTLSASDRRIKMTDWAGRATAKVKSRMELLDKYAGHGGMLITCLQWMGLTMTRSNLKVSLRTMNTLLSTLLPMSGSINTTQRKLLGKL